MTRDEADRERDRLAEEHPESTWLVVKGEGGWEVLKVGIAQATGATGASTEARPKPPYPEDPGQGMRNVPYGNI